MNRKLKKAMQHTKKPNMVIEQEDGQPKELFNIA